MDPRLEHLPLVATTIADVAALAERAFLSSLTRLPNRAAFYAVRESISEASDLLVAFMDLTGFKAINDGFGYAGGNATIAQAGQLWLSIAESLSGQAFHFSGDEFVMMLPSDRAAEFERLFDGRMGEFSLVYEGRVINGRANAGLCAPDEGTLLDEQLKRAEVACKLAKQMGGRGVVMWHPEVDNRGGLIDVRWRCERCGATVSYLVESNRHQGNSRCANCGEIRAALEVA